MNHRIPAVIVLVALGAGAAWYVKARGADPAMKLAGTIEARDVQVGSLVGGRVLEVLAQEGDTLAAGATIVTLESSMLDAQVAEQEARLRETEARLANVRRGPDREAINRARIDWESAERNRRRAEALHAERVLAAGPYEDAVSLAADRLETLKELERGSRPEVIAEAEAARGREARRLDYLRRQRAELTVIVPVGGVVQSLDLRPGDLVAAGQAVASLLEPDQIWVRVYVPETRLGDVRLGQIVSLVVDSWPKRTFAGRVVEVKARAEYLPRNVQTLEQRSEQVFGVKVAIAPSAELKAGMAAIVTLGGPEALAMNGARP